MKGKKWIWLILAAMLGMLCLDWPESREPEVFFQEPSLETLQPLVQEYHQRDVVFAVTLDDYIRCFNSLYESQYQSDYFPGSFDWSISQGNRGIHTDYPVLEYRFSEDPQVFSLPTVTIFTPMEKRYIQELNVNFDEHSYTEAGYQRYRLLCADTLRVFFPEWEGEAAWEQCDEILSVGNAHIFSSEEWYGKGAVPYALFYKGNVGVYSYDAIGDWRHFCVIPLTRERLTEFQEKGVVLYEIE